MLQLLNLRTLLLTGVLAAFMLSMSGCSAMHTAIKKKDLDVQTKMSETVFLEPTAPDRKIIYFDLRNTSDKDIQIKDKIAAVFTEHGYRITQNPDEATFMLQGNILKVGKSDLRAANGYLESGFGGSVVGAAAGYAIASGSSGRAVVGAGLIGGALGLIGDALVDDVLYVMITDLQIRERPLDGEVITQVQQANLQQGSATRVMQDSRGGKVKWKTYRTRIVSTANQVNLEFEEAKPVLESALIRSISGIF